MTQDQTNPRAEGLANTIWVLIGPGSLSILAIIIMQAGRGWLSLISLAFLVVLGAVSVARWLDPTNSDGTRVTPGQRLFYVLVTISMGLAGWIGAHLLRIYWMES